jgi:hypothetical protein
LGAAEEKEKTDKEKNRENEGAEGPENPIVVTLGEYGDIDVVFAENIDKLGVTGGEVDEDGGTVGGRDKRFSAIATDINPFDIACLDFLEKLTIPPGGPALGLLIKEGHS